MRRVENFLGTLVIGDDEVMRVYITLQVWRAKSPKGYLSSGDSPLGSCYFPKIVAFIFATTERVCDSVK